MTWPKEEPWINDITIKVLGLCGLVVHRITSNARVLKAGVITAHINAQGVHSDPTGAI